MKALYLRQPWAHAVLHYGKTLENRRWNTSFRGEFLIHAAKGMTREEYEDAEEFIGLTLGWFRGGSSGIANRVAFESDFKERGKRGGIVGIARLVDVIRPCATTGESESLFRDECGHAWHIPEQYAFVLEDVRPLPFIPWKGELSFFDVPSDYAERAQP